jgi:hypothetical protein
VEINRFRSKGKINNIIELIIDQDGVMGKKVFTFRGRGINFSPDLCSRQKGCLPSACNIDSLSTLNLHLFQFTSRSVTHIVHMYVQCSYRIHLQLSHSAGSTFIETSYTLECPHIICFNHSGITLH